VAAGAVKAKKSRAVWSSSPDHADDIVEDNSCVSDNRTRQKSELEMGSIASKKAKKNKSRLSEIDSGILMEDEEDNSAVGSAPRRKVSSQDASVEQESLTTLAYPPQTKSRARNIDAQTSVTRYKQSNSSRKCVTFSSEKNVKTLPESSDTMLLETSDSPPASDGRLRNVVPEFSDADDEEFPNADDHSEFMRKKPKLPQLEKKQTRKTVDKQHGCTSSNSRRRIVSNNETDNDSDGHHGADDDLIAIDVDEPASATNHLAMSKSHTDTGIVVLL